jgi:hypothetical protein
MEPVLRTQLRAAGSDLHVHARGAIVSELLLDARISTIDS